VTISGQPLTPIEIAQLAATAMWREDRASQRLGIEILEAGVGEATLAMKVDESMVNGHGLAHGGFIFALADSAFAFACNSHGLTAVAAQCEIAFLRPAKLGDRLVAMAREISKTGRSGITDVRVTVGGLTIAEFRGHSRIIGGSFIAGAGPSEAAKPVA